MKNNKNTWDLVISPRNKFINFKFKEIFHYRDLILLLVKRDFVTFYKQTILGPLWYIIQPLINTLIFTIIFGELAKISTEGTPPFIFYMSGNIIWGYFAACLTLTSNTFVSNADIFGKVYFPRMIIPISHILITVLQFLLQFVFFICFLIYFSFKGFEFQFTINLFLIPLLIIMSAFLSLGMGCLISALTAKYRDLTFAMSFSIQLLMYLTPVVYPLSVIPEKYQIIAAINPMTSIVELFRNCFFHKSSIQFNHISISFIMIFLIFIIGIIIFNRTEKNFMDSV